MIFIIKVKNQKIYKRNVKKKVVEMQISVGE